MHNLLTCFVAETEVRLLTHMKIKCEVEVGEPHAQPYLLDRPSF